MKRVLIVSGRKGGVGKSLVSGIVVGALQEAGRRPVLVDADYLTRDVATRHATDAFLAAPPLPMDLSAAGAWLRLTEALEAIEQGEIVINMGADVTGVDSAAAADFAAAMAEMAGEVTAIWVMTATAESAAHTLDSLKSGVLAHAGRRILVKNLVGGRRAEDFARFDAAVDSSQFNAILELDELMSELIARLVKTPLRSEAALPTVGNAFARLRYKRWWQATRAEFERALGLDEERADGPAT